jgi:hypothetical protein
MGPVRRDRAGEVLRPHLGVGGLVGSMEKDGSMRLMLAVLVGSLLHESHLSMMHAGENKNAGSSKSEKGSSNNQSRPCNILCLRRDIKAKLTLLVFGGLPSPDCMRAG